ncbi:MAG: hypothetical protein HKN04_04545 [Rhodothermaceae bacterium]|nr:hypothetical protein [Rhodothermaceae bacterium]
MRPCLLLTALCLLFAGCSTSAEPNTAPDSSRALIRGLTLDAVEAPPSGTLQRLAALGTTHLALIPYGFQERHDSPSVRFNPEPRWYSESGTGARALAAAGDSLGLDIVLKPQLWLGRNADDHWSATIGFETDADWQAWEASYRAYILHHARVATEIESPLFVIGTELARAVQERPAFWRSLADEVRTVYPGPITYAANWYEDAEHVTFWDALDVIGVQAYFPLAEATDTTHTVEDLVAAWAPHKAMLASLAERTGKPVLFTEVGYRSVPYAAAEPWRWPTRDEVGTTPADTALQQQLYEAFFLSFWDEPWFAGALVWKWTIRPEERRRRWRPAGADDLGFSPEGKPAEQVLADWFSR